MELSSAPASVVALLLEQRYGAVGNSFCNFVDSEDLSHLVRCRSRSCPNLLLLAAEQPLAMPRKEVTVKEEEDVCRVGSGESFSTQFTETDLDVFSSLSMSDDETCTPDAVEHGCMLSIRRWESIQEDWEVSSEQEVQVALPSRLPQQPIQDLRRPQLRWQQQQQHQQQHQQQQQMPQEAAVTTLMMQNIPMHLAQRDVAIALEALGLDFDFLYMPSNFRTGAPHGYAFVNLTSPAAAARLKALWAGRRPLGGAGRPLSVLPADVQGLEANVKKWDTAKMRRVRNPEHRPLVKANRQIVRS